MCSIQGRNVLRAYQRKALEGTQKTGIWSKLQCFRMESEVYGSLMQKSIGQSCIRTPTVTEGPQAGRSMHMATGDVGAREGRAFSSSAAYRARLRTGLRRKGSMLALLRGRRVGGSKTTDDLTSLVKSIQPGETGMWDLRREEVLRMTLRLGTQVTRETAIRERVWFPSP